MNESERVFVVMQKMLDIERAEVRLMRSVLDSMTAWQRFKFLIDPLFIWNLIYEHSRTASGIDTTGERGK